ncbi:DNA cytosine methyltransferase [Flavobacterium sp. CS20]|uniref:DNA cytosine methyltransferase n=1 Tax=Flavobacterium sp. CS20 TaxID=2775246 RepID=UPI001B3A5DD2|nr:DNA cytosine methyltransferase [Flavobacterium sp. CS20]QTY26488.1 DNA cytosine methyltransferase [Flavobacterium sp. CS20]
MLKKTTTFENVDNLKFKINIYDPDNTKQASFTHFLQNQENVHSSTYKNSAVEYVKEILEGKSTTEKISDKVAEDALQYLLFNNTEDIPYPAPKRPYFSFIDLFAGVGGFRIALQNVGGKCVYTSEWDENAQKTYYKNFGDIPFGDITKKRVKEFIPHKFDILCAGFPCQAFSIAGYRKGFSDTRGTLFFDVEQVIEKHNPKVVFLENVKNLISHDKGKTFKVILEILEKKLGYKVFYEVLNSMTHANIPQNRERIFIVAFDPKQVKDYNKFKFPKQIKLTKTIHNILEKDKKDDKFYYPNNHKYYPELEKTMTSKDTVYQWRRVYVRENKSQVCPTLTANMGTGGHNVPLIKDDFGIRKLTPKECFAFQGYQVDKFILPDLSNSKLYKQAGNSVTTTLVERISQEIMKVL